MASSPRSTQAEPAPGRYPTNLALKHFVYFAAVVELGTLGRAAQALNITQPALTKSVHALERQLKAPLLERTARGVIPTRLGAEVARYALEITASLRRIQSDVEALRGVRASSAHVRADAASMALVARAVAHRLAVDSPIEAVLRESTARRALEALLAGDADLAVLAGYHGELPDALERRELGRDPGIAVVRAGHPATRETSGGPALAAWTVVSPPPPSALHAWWNRTLGPVVPGRRVRTGSLVAARRIVLESDAACVFPRSFVADDVVTGRLVRLDVPGLDWSLSRCLVTRRQHAGSPAKRALADEIVVQAEVDARA